jgi:acetolactate synthase-1/2/3 large subunit
MNGMEVATAVNYDIPIVWIVENNSLLGLVHELQRFDLGENTVSTTFKEIDCAKIAEGLGAKGYNIQKPGELKKVLPKALKSGKPTVIDVNIDPTEVPPIEGFVHGIEKLNDRLAYL